MECSIHEYSVFKRERNRLSRSLEARLKRQEKKKAETKGGKQASKRTIIFARTVEKKTRTKGKNQTAHSKATKVDSCYSRYVK